MNETTLLYALPIALLLVAMLYASVGHGGASGYIAMLTLAGIAPAEIRPLALLLNIGVASLALYRFTRANHVQPSHWRLLGWLALSAVPCAYLGGQIQLHTAWLSGLIGLSLLVAAFNLLWQVHRSVTTEAERGLAVHWALIIGALLGLLSGLTGVGGGIFLSPLLLALGAVSVRGTAGIAAGFIVLNSTSGLLGWLSKNNLVLPDAAYLWIAAALLGGLAGAWIGARKAPPKVLRILLAVVLLIAAWKLIAKSLAL